MIGRPKFYSFLNSGSSKLKEDNQLHIGSRAIIYALSIAFACGAHHLFKEKGTTIKQKTSTTKPEKDEEWNRKRLLRVFHKLDLSLLFSQRSWASTHRRDGSRFLLSLVRELNLYLI